MRLWLSRVAAWCSQTINLWLLFGHHDMTVSARCYINRREPYWCLAHAAINRLFFWEPDHCRLSFERDVEYSREIERIYRYEQDLLRA